ncbi:MAG: FeoA domain-containing protein [Anaerolineae bacterium]|nr:FeoA domain-containing protein [Anaerolineae bacterium]
MHTPAVEDYLKVIYELMRETHRATTTGIADRLGVAPASVTGMVKKLAEMRLIEHKPYQGVDLTPAGERIALEVIRHHRLIELYLAESLGLPWDAVHAEAHRLEHAVSPMVADRMAAALGYPRTDPHGAPIPSKEGAIAAVASRRLSDMGVGDVGVVAEVIDEDAALLRALAAIGLYPQVQLDVRAVDADSGAVTIRIAAADHVVPFGAATRIFIHEDADMSDRDAEPLSPMSPRVVQLDHVLITAPTGGEDEARRFYGEWLGLTEIEKPATLKGRGGVWFSVGNRQLHIGIQDGQDNAAARRHIALLVEGLDALRARLEAAGIATEDDALLPGYRRFYARDPFGNRTEFLEPTV